MVMGDRLSELPDGLLSLILSKLPIADAIGCSILSKRWRYLYTEIPHLFLSPALLTPTRLLPLEPNSLLSMAAVEGRISHILRFHSSDVDSFLLSNSTDITNPWNIYSAEFGEVRPETLCNWVQCVARKNVKRLFLKSSCSLQIPPLALFSCTRLTTLTLFSYNLTHFPTDFLGFRNLTDCTLVAVKITDNSLSRFLSLCPLLQKLSLEICYGVRKPVISALNVTYLNVDGCDEVDLTVNCPNLKTLKSLAEDLKVNGMGFQELSPSIRRIEMELGSNLIGLSLDLRFAVYDLTANRFLELVGTFKSLKVLSIYDWREFFEEEQIVVPLLNLLSRLPNLERFHLRGKLLFETPERDPIPPSLMTPLPNLQFVEIEMNECDERELHLLGSLVQIAPALKQVKLRPARECNNEWYNLFLEKLQSLKKRLEEGTETICEFNFCY